MEDFVEIFRDLYWDESSIDGRRLGFFDKLWYGIKCAGIAVGAGLTWKSGFVCGSSSHQEIFNPFLYSCGAMVNNTKTNCRGINCSHNFSDTIVCVPMNVMRCDAMHVYVCS